MSANTVSVVTTVIRTKLTAANILLFPYGGQWRVQYTLTNRDPNYTMLLEHRDKTYAKRDDAVKVSAGLITKALERATYKGRIIFEKQCTCGRIPCVILKKTGSDVSLSATYCSLSGKSTITCLCGKLYHTHHYALCVEARLI